MSKQLSPYYTMQLSKLNLDTSRHMAIELSDGEGNKTNLISLNSESIAVLKEFLDHYELIQKAKSKNVQDSDEDEEDECMHDDAENGFCINCGKEVDWVGKVFGGDI